MEKDLNHLLFHKTVLLNTGEKGSLFRFQSELADSILNTPEYKSEDGSERSNRSIRPYLSQTLKKKNQPNERSMSDRLKRAIKEVIRNRLHKDEPLFNNIDIEFDEAYEILKVESSQKQDEEYYELFDWQIQANRTAIFNREPSEAKWDSDPDKFREVEKLMTHMIRNLFRNVDVDIIDATSSKHVVDYDLKDLKIDSSKDINKMYFYHFYVPSFNVAKDVWRGLLKYLLSYFLPPSHQKEEFKKRLDFAVELIKALTEPDTKKPDNKERYQFVKVHKVDEFLTSVPLVYYECTDGISIKSYRKANKEYESLFNLVLYEGVGHSVGKIKGVDLEFWKEYVYYPLHWSENSMFEKEEINLKRALSHILRLIEKDYK